MSNKISSNIRESGTKELIYMSAMSEIYYQKGLNEPWPINYKQTTNLYTLIITIMKNVFISIFSLLLVIPLTSKAQQEQFPAGTVANEHNINGADYPRLGNDKRVHFNVYAPVAETVEISFWG